jgi:hypothetical protein
MSTNTHDAKGARTLLRSCLCSRNHPSSFDGHGLQSEESVSATTSRSQGVLMRTVGGGTEGAKWKLEGEGEVAKTWVGRSQRDFNAHTAGFCRIYTPVRVTG